MLRKYDTTWHVLVDLGVFIVNCFSPGVGSYRYTRSREWVDMYLQFSYPSVRCVLSAPGKTSQNIFMGNLMSVSDIGR